MIIGVDFDNTLISYDALFHRVALEKGLIPEGLPANKIALRNHLRRAGREEAWTELQGFVYGPALADAPPFAGALDFFHECRRRGNVLHIISHKTRHPHLGPRHDLHAAARAWLENNGFLTGAATAAGFVACFFEPSLEAKLARIAACGCTEFIDDLPEFLLHPGFPPGVRRVLFDPGQAHPAVKDLERCASWPEVARLLWTRTSPAPGRATAGEGARKLLASAGRILAGEPEALPGGVNNRAYAVADGQGRRYFLKHYFHDPADSRDRFATERAFYAYIQSGGITGAPEPLGWDEANRLGLFEFVEGRRLESAEIGAPEVERTLEFLRALNRPRDGAEAKNLPDVSEACFSVGEHLLMLERRLARLQNFPTATAIDARAAEFVRDRLAPSGTRLRQALIEAAASSGGTDVIVPAKERCISPSDFGFHNCLRRPGGDLVFFDFEYAGWDDPAKTICDFFCQPKVPVPGSFFASFSGEIAAMLHLPRPREFMERCRLLLPLYQLKWCCIMLNEFSAGDRGRRDFSLGAQAAEGVKERQLAQAAAALGRSGFDCQR